MRTEGIGTASYPSPPQVSLTDRELSILRLVSEGFSDREIALRLSVAVDTVKWYNKRIYTKLDVHNRTQAASRADALGLLNGHAQTESVPPAAPVQPHPRNNLPARVSSFVGRQREIVDIKAILADSRLLTLTGIGGSGKTQLALHVAREIAMDFDGDVYYVPLAQVTTADHILWRIAEHLNLRFDVHREPLGQLVDYFQQKKMLLVLDNFDHLISAAGLITELLQAAPEMTVLVTSRERLNISGERTFPLAGMALPDDRAYDQAALPESMQLFIERAESVNPALVWSAETLRHVGRICHLVEGMPLGIELAATWMDTLSPQEIADEIEQSLDILEAQAQDLPESQRSIRAAFDRSWHLLDQDQQAAYRRLSVFRGGFTREASEVVAQVPLRILQALVSKSLLRRNPHTGRYEFHELLRHYAQEHLEASSEAHLVYQAHGAYFAAFMAERWPAITSQRQKSIFQEVEADIENVRAAWQYALAQRNIGQIGKFLHTLWALYDVRGWYLSGIELLDAAIDVTRPIETEEARATLGWLLAAKGLFSVSGEIYDRSSTPAPLWMVDYGLYLVRVDARRAYALAQEGVRILKQLTHHEEMLIIPLISLFTTSCLLDEEGVPLQTAQDCLEAATTINDPWAIAKARQMLAVKAIDDGDYRRAEKLAGESLAAFRASGDYWSMSVLYVEVLGLLAIRQKQFEAAKEWLQAGLEAAQEIDFRYAAQTAYWQLGFVAALEENYMAAGTYWARAVEVAEQILGGTTFLGFGGSTGP